MTTKNKSWHFSNATMPTIIDEWAQLNSTEDSLRRNLKFGLWRNTDTVDQIQTLFVL